MDKQRICCLNNIGVYLYTLNLQQICWYLIISKHNIYVETNMLGVTKIDVVRTTYM